MHFDPRKNIDLVISSSHFMHFDPRKNIDLGYSDQLSFANQNARAFARSYSNGASYRQATSCILIHASILILVISSSHFMHFDPRKNIDLGYSDQLSFANQNARAFARSSSNGASYRQATSCMLIHAKVCNVFLERCHQLPVSLRPRFVTLCRCHGTQERVANVSAPWEDKGCAELPLPSCAIAAHSVPTTASNKVDSVMNGNVQVHVAR